MWWLAKSTHLALVVATQGHLKEDVERLERTVDEQLTLMLGGLAALVAWANGVVK
jgi:hypothetical protein